MSGGSFSYLYGRDDDIAPDVYLSMADVMDRWPDAQARLRQLAKLLDDAKAIHREMSGVMHDVEWWQSRDYGEDQVDEGVEEWRKKSA